MKKYKRKEKHICDYGCGQTAFYQLKNGKWCCNVIQTKCIAVRKKCSNALKQRFSNPNISHPFQGRKHTEDTLKKMREVKLGKKLTKEHKEKIGRSLIGKMAGENNPMYNVKGEDHHFYGKHHTEETRRKISNAKKGNCPKHLSDTHKESIRQSMIGREIPREWREKIRNAKLGTKASKETRMKLSLMRKNDKHWNWQGGISRDPYCCDWTNDLKEIIKIRDGFICQNCFSDKNLCVHHIDYDKKNCDFENLITVCISCNSKANFNRDLWQEKFNKKLSMDNKETCYG